MRRPPLVLVVAFLLVLSATGEAAAAGSTGWSHLGHGSTVSLPALNGAVDAVNLDEPGVLLVGGAFTDAGGHPAADHIAAWNGKAWSALGSSALNADVDAIAYHAGKVYAGGKFTNAGGNGNADFLAVWDGSTWSPFCTSVDAGPAFSGSIAALQIIGNTLYVGGAFGKGAGITSANFLLACDLTTGAASSTVTNSDGLNGGVYALTADSNGVLYAGGLFINVDHIAAADHVAAYDGTWHAMGLGPLPDSGVIEGIVRSLAAHGTNVYVGTDVVNVGGFAQADHVVRWNGSAWSAVGANTGGTDGWFPASSFIYALATSGSTVFASGSFQNANGLATADEIAYFDGTVWHPIGSDGAGNGPLNQQGSALGVFNGGLVVGGNFLNAGGDQLADSLGAFPLRRPDARIGTNSAGPFSGNNVYSATAAGESKSISIAAGSRATMYADIQNDGLLTAAMKVTGSGGSNGFTVSYFRGTTNVTSAVEAGTYLTGALVPGAHVTLRIVIHAPTAAGRTAHFLVTARSSTGNPPDAIAIHASN